MKKFFVFLSLILMTQLAESQISIEDPIELEQEEGEPRDIYRNRLGSVLAALPNCDNTSTLIGCNYISNGGIVPSSIYNPFYGPHLYNTFSIPNVMPSWSNLTGSPRIADLANPYSPSLPPSGYSNYASLQSFGVTPNSPTNGTSDAITQKIPSLVAGQTYNLSFFLKFFALGTATSPVDMDKFNIALVHCNQLASMAGGSWAPAPNLPNNAQIIYCESNVNNTNWKKILIEFTASENYDAIVIFPKQRLSQPYPNNSADGRVNITGIQLVNKNIFAISSSSTPNSCIVTLSLPCLLNDYVYTWKDQNGNVVGNGQQITVNSATNSGNYSVSINVPPASNNSCSNSVTQTLQSSINVSSCSQLNIINAVASFYSNTSGSALQNQNLQSGITNNLCYNVNELLKLSLTSSEPTGNHWEFFFTNYNLLWYGFVYNIGDEFSQNIDGFFAISPYENGELEIRLSNSVTGNSKSIFVRLQHYNISYWWERINNPTYEYQIISQASTSNNPYNSYNWTFPSGMQADNLNTELPKFTFGSYGGSYPANATLLVTNQYCPSYTANVPLQPGLRMALQNSNKKMEDLKNASKLSIFPNPAKTDIKIETSKKIQNISISTIEGKVLKYFKLSNNDLHANVDISFLSKGVYNVKIIYTDFTTESKLIIKE